ncbi:hypothetical protein RJ640_018084 [Escallonia rubra]|uniref:Uncharacterized protein n=1 Tax=Escallonia rubra TaxID=112253 RepID=A0AA88QBJ7_9ASTE|nr:hypothetical protein RJ640_018084 [Escallonia rubra]
MGAGHCSVPVNMPKGRRDRSTSFDRSRSSPFFCSSSSKHSLPQIPLENEKDVKEWEEARCPVCMEHPHNAILLMCSSHEKGCRPYMCDTSYRHSNCFDQFRKSFTEASPTMAQQDEAPVPVTNSLFHEETPIHALVSEATISHMQGGISEEGSSARLAMACENQEKSKLQCPLCRGQINGWKVVEPARHLMNAKSRGCACETCEFSGTYTDLRKHARLVHPLVRPSEADPERERDWRRLERQRDLGDLISTLQSSLGDERSEDSTLSFDGGWMHVIFLIRVIRTGNTLARSRLSGTARSRSEATARSRPGTRHWGETYDADSREDENETSDGGSGPRRVRRRLRRGQTPDES